METFLSLFVFLIMCGSIQLQTSDIEETIYTGGHPISVLKDRGKSRRLEFKKTPFLKIGDLKNPPGTYPWEVSVGLVDPKARGHWLHYCGGVIASKTHVITSANCLDFMVESEYAGCSVTDIHIRAGDYHLKVENEMIKNIEIQEIKISNYTVHPEFNRTEYPEDIQHYKNIAVITLEESLSFEHISVRSIYIPSLEEAEQITKKSNTDVSLVLSGWGRWTSKNGIKHNPGEVLRDGIIATFDDTYCESVYNETRLSEGFTDDIMCGANPLNLAGVCCGDDGSGVVKLDHERERFVLTGILSLGTEWNNEAEELSCGHKDKPNILVRVASKSIITFLYESIYGVPAIPNQTEEVSDEQFKMEVSQYGYEDCGLNTAIEDDYNYSDETNKTGVWPWLVSLRKQVYDLNDYSYNSYKWKHFCGGTILSTTRILTAAHCVYDFNGLDTVIMIRAGDALLNNNNDDGDIQEIVIQNFTVHPDYTHNLRYFDLAILELENPLIFSKYVRPVCLLSLEEAMNISKSAEEYLPMCVAGWGNKGDKLKHTVATVFSEETCNRTHPNKIDYRNLVPDLFTEDTMCAGDPAGESGTCRGDSGSGAVHFEQHRQRYVQRAIVSGSAHGLCGSMYYPNVYVRLSNPDILQWIFDEIGFFPPKPVAVSDKKLIDSDTTLLCTTSPAMPASAITWIVRDQNENLVDHKKLSETSTKTDEGFITSSYVKITTSKAVSVQCEAKNVAGKQTNNSINELVCATLFEHVDYAGDSFNLYSNKPISKLVDSGWNDKISSIRILEGSIVHAFEHINFAGQKQEINSDTNAVSPNDWISSLRCHVPGPGQILIQSEAGAAEYQGYVLGYYDLLPQLLHKRPAYQQRGGPNYLYYNEDKGKWKVSRVLGGNKSSLGIQSNAYLPPTSGWKYAKEKRWADDDTLKVKLNTEDEDWCSHLNVSSTGPAALRFPSRMGRYSWTGEWSSGRKAYSNGIFYLTVRTGTTEWGIRPSKDIEGATIKSGKAPVCPCNNAGPSLRYGRDGWQYSDNGWKTDMSIKVTCD